VIILSFSAALSTIMKRIGHLLFFYCLLGGIAAWGQQLAQQTRYLTVNEGLLHTDATTLGKDRKGFIWIGSYGGLNRFDGYELKPYINATDKLQRVYQNRINRLLVDTSRSLIWLATQGGLTLFDLHKEQYVPLVIPDVKLAERIHKTFTHLQIDRAGNLWLALPNGLCVVRYNAETKALTEEKTTGVPATEVINGMTTDASGNVWFIGQRGVFRTRSDRSVQRMPLFDEQNQERTNFSGMLFDKHNQLVLGASNGLMIVRAGQVANGPWQGRFYTILPGTLTNTGDQAVTFNALAESPKGGYFLGSPFGLIQATPQTNQLIIQPMPRSGETLFFSNHISQIYTDQDASTLWVATFGGGVRYYNLSPKPFFLIQQGPAGNRMTASSGSYIRALKEDRNGNLWIGTRTSGLDLYNFAQAWLHRRTDQQQYSLTDRRPARPYLGWHRCGH
jgi:ligand-binding sensor domain-containing protein